MKYLGSILNAVVSVAISIAVISGLYDGELVIASLVMIVYCGIQLNNFYLTEYIYRQTDSDYKALQDVLKKIGEMSREYDDDIEELKYLNERLDELNLTHSIRDAKVTINMIGIFIIFVVAFIGLVQGI